MRREIIIGGGILDFKTVLGLILEGFHKENIRYGLIGGFALGALVCHELQ